MNSNDNLSATWRMPIILAGLSIFGLLSALIGDGSWDTLSWLALGVPLIIIAWSLLKPGKQVK